MKTKNYPGKLYDFGVFVGTKLPLFQMLLLMVIFDSINHFILKRIFIHETLEEL